MNDRIKALNVAQGAAWITFLKTEDGSKFKPFVEAGLDANDANPASAEGMMLRMGLTFPPTVGNPVLDGWKNALKLEAANAALAKKARSSRSRNDPSERPFDAVLVQILSDRIGSMLTDEVNEILTTLIEGEGEYAHSGCPEVVEKRVKDGLETEEALNLLAAIVGFGPRMTSTVKVSKVTPCDLHGNPIYTRKGKKGSVRDLRVDNEGNLVPSTLSFGIRCDAYRGKVRKAEKAEKADTSGTAEAIELPEGEE